MSSNKFESKVNKSVDDSDMFFESDSSNNSSDSSSNNLPDNPRIICHVISQNIPNRTYHQIMNGNRRRNKKYRNPASKDYLDQILKNIEELTKNVDYNENKPKMVIDSHNNSILSRKKLNLDQFESEVMKNLSNKIIENIEDLNKKHEEIIETINKLNEPNDPEEESKDSSSSDTFEESSETSSSEDNQEVNEPETINDEKLIQISNELIENCKNKLRNYQYFFFGCLLVLILVSIFNSSH